jgi:predicted DNA-binding transcriptional regulator YafY
MKRLSRLLYLINYLSSRYGASVVDLATVCGVSKRTIFRDIRDIHQAGFPIYYHHGYRILRPRSMLPGDYTVDEIKALIRVLAEENELSFSTYEGVLRAIQARVKGAVMEAGKSRVIVTPMAVPTPQEA